MKERKKDKGDFFLAWNNKLENVCDVTNKVKLDKWAIINNRKDAKQHY